MNQLFLNRKLCAIFFVLTGLLCTGPQPLRADIIIDGYTANTNDRFTNNAAFIGSGFNFSGVGQAGSGRWATAISPNVVISAAHFAPSDNVLAPDTINFYSSNDPGSLVTRSIIPGSGERIPGTDLYLATLDSNLPASISFYNFANQLLSGPAGSLANAGIFQNMNAYLFGRSPVAHPAGRDQAVGRNRITGYVENLAFNGNTNNDSLLMFYENNSSPEYVSFEAYLQTGDSGAPLFVDMNGQLVLLGINSFINAGGLGGTPPFFSGITYTGNQSTAIQNYINAVPEPGSLLVIAVGQLVWSLRRRRQSV